MKKIGKYFFLLLFAIAFFILPFTYTSASSAPDNVISAARTCLNNFPDNLPSSVISDCEKYGKIDCNTYIMYKSYLNRYELVIMREPDYIYADNGNNMCFHLSATGLGKCSIAFTYFYDGTNFIFNKVDGNYADVDCNILNIRYCSSYADIVNSNINIKTSDGTTVFHLAPLKGRILAAANREIQSNQLPHLLEIAKVVAIVLVSSILLLILLPKLVKKSFRLLLR